MDEWAKRYDERGWSMRPASYQIRFPDGSTDGWLAQTYIRHELRDGFTLQSVQEGAIKVYDTKEEADEVAIRLGVSWLEKHALLGKIANEKGTNL